MCAVFVALILKFQAVISVERTRELLTTNLFKIAERAGVDKIHLADLLKIHLGVELDPQNGISSCELEKVSFCSQFNTKPPTEEADSLSESKNFQKPLLKSMPF